MIIAEPNTTAIREVETLTLTLTLTLRVSVTCVATSSTPLVFAASIIVVEFTAIASVMPFVAADLVTHAPPDLTYSWNSGPLKALKTLSATAALMPTNVSSSAEGSGVGRARGEVLLARGVDSAANQEADKIHSK